MKKIIYLGLLSIPLGLFNTSCQKKEKELVKRETKNVTVNTSLQENKDYHNINIHEGYTKEERDYMNSLPLFDMENLKKVIDQLPNSQTKSAGHAWGIGYNNRVFKSTNGGSSWSEPNPAARLKYVEIGSYGTGVWGISTSNKIWKWNGHSWYQPNSAASLYYLTAFDDNSAIGIGWNGQLYITDDGGYSWDQFTNITGVHWISGTRLTGNYLWITTGSTISPQTIKYLDFDVQPRVWTSTTIQSEHFDAFLDGIYSINSSNKIYKAFWNSAYYSGFTQPNPNAGLYQISAGTDGLAANAWGIGSGSRIFRTNDGGLSWSEPNPAAKLYHISAQ